MQKPATAPSPVATRLRLARERLRLTQGQLAERVEIGESSISEFENGHRSPSLAQLNALAQAVGVSLAWLLDDSAPAGDVVLWRARPETAIAAQVESRFLRLCEQYRNLEAWCEEVSEVKLPAPPQRSPKQFGFSDAAELAKQFRDAFQLGDRPGEGLMRTLEELCGVKIFHESFEPSGTAACVRSERFGSAILLNTENVPWRRAFDLSHELFHLLTWDVFSPGWSGDPRTATEFEERLADVFAGNLLMPVEAFRIAVERRMSDPNPRQLDDIYAVARQFDVSVQAVLLRMKYVFRIDEKRIAEAREAWSAYSAFCEDRTRIQPPDRPERFQALAQSAVRRGEMSIGRFAEYMGLSRQKALAMIPQHDRDGGKETSTAPA